MGENVGIFPVVNGQPDPAKIKTHALNRSLFNDISHASDFVQTMGVRVQTTRGPCHCVDERCCWRWRQLKLNSSYHLSLLLGFLTPSPTKNKYKGAASVRSAQGHSCDKFIHLQNTHVGLHSCLWLFLGSIVAVEGNSVHENPEALCPYYDRRVVCWSPPHFAFPGYSVHN